MPSEETKRLISEIIALYSLEETLKEIYVEGNIDENFYQNYLHSKKIQGNFVSVETINFFSIPENFKSGLDIKSNKNKLIVLSRVFDAQSKKFNVRCIVDRDFDDYIPSDENDYLWRTDFSCLEAYLFCKEVKGKFIRIGLRNFPIELKKITSEIGKVIKFLFAVRLWREINNPSLNLVELDKNLGIDRKSGKINFDEKEYANKFISKNNLHGDKNKVITEINSLQKKLNSDVRFAMNKYDFLKVFYLYINKIKNTPNYREENFCNSLYLTPESSHLEKHNLFKEIEEFFLNK